MTLQTLDADLAALAEARDAARRAKAAFDAFAGATQEEIDRILGDAAKEGRITLVAGLNRIGFVAESRPPTP